MVRVGEVVVNAELCSRFTKLCSNTEVHLQLPKYTWLHVHGSFKTILVVCWRSVNKRWTSLVQTGCCWRSLNRHKNIIAVNHTSGCWSSLKLLMSITVVSTFAFATLEQLLWDFFWQPFLSWGHTWRTFLKLFLTTLFFFLEGTLEELLWNLFLANFFLWGHTWRTSLKLFLITLFFSLLRAHLKDVFETSFSTSLFFFEGTLEGLLWSFLLHFFLVGRDLHLRDFWGFAVWLDRVTFRVF